MVQYQQLLYAELMSVRIFPPDGRKTHMRNDTIIPLGLWYHKNREKMEEGNNVAKKVSWFGPD